MNYGHFDEKTGEYVITKPDTPAAWVNYLGSPEYGAIISNNAAGYSFEKSGANGRVLRARFNSLSADQPGRYVYIKDRENGDFWSVSWAPVCKPFDKFKSECRHAPGYTKISSEYSGISAEVSYYVPMGKTYEVWAAVVKNNSDKPRRLSVTGVCEFVNNSNYEQDGVNLQYSLFITKTEYKGSFIFQHQEDANVEKPVGRFFALAREKVSAYCGDRTAFLGNYRGYQNPVGIEEGLKDTLNFCGNSVGALQSDIKLQPGESRELTYIVGCKTEAEAAKLSARYEKEKITAQELAELKIYWQQRLGALKVKTPDPDFNNMINTWNAYNCFITFIWSRAASMIYCGLRNGYGYRDTVQDIQGIIHLAPEDARKQIEFMLSAQVSSGAGLPLVKFNHNAGHENTPDDESYVKETGHPSYRADDALWLFPTVYKYIGESGDAAFLDKEIVFAEKNEKASVYEHLKRAINFSMTHQGNHGLPAGLHADWNDCLRLGKKGESTFVAFQLVYAVKIMREFAEYKKDKEYLKRLDEIDNWLGIVLKDCWDTDRFIRGYRESGEKIGTRADKEASMWLNPQSWAVISGFADAKTGEKALNTVERELNTPYGAMLMYPPYVKNAFDGALMQCYNVGTKENAGIFSQPQGWLILAEAKLGRGDKAYKYWREACPAAFNDSAEKRVIEPYAYGQFVEGKDSPEAGRAHVHWLTGTASTVMVSAVEGILGLIPTADGIKIDPSIPSEWNEITITKRFRQKILNITIKNPNKNQHGVKTLRLNGKALPDNFVPAAMLEKENDIIVEI